MEQLEKIKNMGKETLDTLVAQSKEQPESVQKWGVTGASAVGGALVIGATAKGLLGIIATLANPPVALTVGAVGGGLLGWSYIQKYFDNNEEDVVDESSVDPEPVMVTIAPAEG